MEEEASGSFDLRCHLLTSSLSAAKLARCVPAVVNLFGPDGRNKPIQVRSVADEMIHFATSNLNDNLELRVLEMCVCIASGLASASGLALASSC